ncbi:GNAT family N-acetyltransferase [Winogradskyella ursingii]|uniref:GNAT family N-acetyltransferase n=1 Tax=Winogradskyella ursingii TaxID=2686079 RepID=UPI0015CB5781|nr:GNAT family N-acetyltransferase [Winogradskyella ursingii]
MEADKKGLSNKVKWISNIIKHGLFLHGVRNNLAKIGLDFMPYYWVREATSTITPPEIRGEDKEFQISIFGKEEINYVKRTIIGIEDKDLMADLKSGELCVGLKNKGTIAAYMFIKRKPFVFRKRHFNLRSEESYLHSMYTFEAFRGKNIAPYLRFHSYKLLEKEGVTKYYSVSEYFNKSTIRFKNKLNSKPVKLYLSMLLFKKWTMNFTLKSYK